MGNTHVGWVSHRRFGSRQVPIGNPSLQTSKTLLFCGSELGPLFLLDLKGPMALYLRSILVATMLYHTPHAEIDPTACLIF